ncbi:AAA ATPase [Dipsacomyces acuminosporus]|nr:AAA ATPase [Dipsacomyces acuminosporus]
MPAARSTRTSQRRKALAEAPLSRHQPAASALKEAATSPKSLKATFNVTKRAVPSGGKDAKPKTVSPFIALKTVLHRSTAAPNIVGRESEQATIRCFLQTTIEQGRGGSLYISGNPGTGKTACLQALIKQSSASFPSVLVNCVPLTRPDQAYSAILDALQATNAQKDAPLAALEKLVFQTKRAFLVILDEVDSLLGSKQEVLYRLFELAAHPDSHMVLVGIANALDLTDRFLPRLQARNCEPQLLNFNPYQISDIVAIIQSRLSSVLPESAESVIQKAALELCARKVAATSGDIRKALDVCRQAMEAAEAESKKKAALMADKENAGTLAAANTSAQSMPKVSLMHIAKVLTTLNGSPIAQKLNALNFQQKLVLCAFVSLAGTPSGTSAASSTPSKKAAGIVISSLYSEYGSICGRLSIIAPVTRSEFLDLVSMMEAQGVVSVEATRGGRRGGQRIISSTGAADDRTMRLAVDEADVRRVLMNTPALKSL